MRLAPLLAFCLLCPAAPVAAANPQFDKLASTVEVLAGATFCNGSAETERQVVQQWADREIGNERIRTIWQEAIDDRVRFLASFKDYNCDPVLTQLASFDIGAFRPAAAAGSADTVGAPAGDDAGEAATARPSDVTVLEPYQDGGPWRQVGEIPVAFRGFFGSEFVCNFAATEYTATGDIVYWQDDPPKVRDYDAIFISGKRVATGSDGITTVFEMTSAGELHRVAHIYPPHINLAEPEPTTFSPCTRAQLASYLPAEKLAAYDWGAEGSRSSTLSDLCVMHEDLIALVFDMHANGARMQDAMSMNGQTFNVNQKLWYFIDRTVEQIYGGQAEAVQQRLGSGKWTEQCSDWLAFV